MSIGEVLARTFVRKNYRGAIDMAKKDVQEELLERFREALKFNKHELDEAVEQHAALFLEVQEEYERAVSMRDELKTAMDETYAATAAEIREGFEEGGERYTDQRIKDAVAVSKEYLDAVAKYQAAKYYAARLGAMVSAFEHRKSMLRIEADLWAGGYWAGTSMKAPAGKLRDRAAEDAREAMRLRRK